MPEQQRVATKESVQPTRSLLSQWFGTDTFTPEMEEGINIARRENPNLAPVQPYGFFSRMLTKPDTFGYVSPGNSIYLNPRMAVGQSPQDIADTLTHEQEHVKQQEASGYGPTMLMLRRLLGNREPYHQRPDELAAFQAEKERRYRMGRMQSASPSISGSWYVPQDIPLPSSKRTISKTAY